jgi:phospholipid transport system substrate-binding protein
MTAAHLCRPGSLLRLLPLLALFAFALVPALRASTAAEARAALASGIDEVSGLLRQNPGKQDLVAVLDQLANQHFAFNTTTRLAIGRDWRDFTPEQQARAVELFSRLIVRTYADRINGDVRPQITYGQPVELRAGRVEVPTTVTTDGQTYAVTYRLELDREPTAARWRIYDVVAEGVSLISNYRSQFEPIVRRSGAPGLLSTLEAKLAEQTSAGGSATPAN